MLACARVNSMREFQLEIFCFTFRTVYVGIKFVVPYYHTDPLGTIPCTLECASTYDVW